MIGDASQEDVDRLNRQLRFLVNIVADLVENIPQKSNPNCAEQRECLDKLGSRLDEQYPGGLWVNAIKQLAREKEDASS